MDLLSYKIRFKEIPTVQTAEDVKEADEVANATVTTPTTQLKAIASQFQSQGIVNMTEAIKPKELLLPDAIDSSQTQQRVLTNHDAELTRELSAHDNSSTEHRKDIQRIISVRCHQIQEDADGGPGVLLGGRCSPCGASKHLLSSRKTKRRPRVRMAASRPKETNDSLLIKGEKIP